MIALTRARLATKDGQKVKLKLPGVLPRAESLKTEERGATDPPRDYPRPTHNPYHGPL